MLRNLKGIATEAGPRSLVLLELVSEAYTSHDWEGLRTLYHDEALLCTVADHESVVGPDEVIEVFKRAAGTAYSVGPPAAVVALDDHAVKVTARVRYPLKGGGIGDSERTWLLTFKDGLVFRSRSYHSRAEARAAYAEHGIERGIHPQR